MNEYKLNYNFYLIQSKKLVYGIYNKQLNLFDF